MSSFAEYCRVHVRVRCQARLGQTVAVVGIGSIGKPIYEKLVTSPLAYPVWTTLNSIVVPRGVELKYRFAIMEGGNVKMVEGKLHERLLLPDKEDVLVEDVSSVENMQLSCTESKLHDGYTAMSENNDQEAWSQFAESGGRLFLVCYHLPVVIRRKDNTEEPFEISWAESLIAKTSGSVSGAVQTVWIGTISLSKKDLTEFESAFVNRVLRDMSCIPVYLDDTIASAAYYGFCKGVMWPVFHNVDQLDQIHAAWNLPTTAAGASSGADNNSSAAGIGQAINGGTRSRSGSRVNELVENKILDWNKKEEENFSAYMQVNTTFAQTLLSQNMNSLDVIWVHDYHLMLVPKMLRNASQDTRQSAKVVFFLHIPFPTSQIFRTLPEANELLSSMLCADLIGFHAFDHARHFLNAAKRMLGIKSIPRQGGMLTLAVNDREVIVTMSHVSIETERFDAILANPETAIKAQMIKDKYKGRKIILGIDVCQRLSGIALKLAGYEKLLSEYNTAEKKGLVLLQRAIRQGSRVEDETITSSDIRGISTDLNRKYSARYATAAVSRQHTAQTQNPQNLGLLKAALGDVTSGSSGENLILNASQQEGDPMLGVLDYEEITSYKGLTLIDRVALYLASDVFLLTPIREGLNLMPLEYIYTRRDLPRAGVVVVSEFSTCSSLLSGSIKINPFSSNSIMEGLEKALGMSGKDMEYRRQRDLPFISSHPSSMWTKQILGELAQLQNESKKGINNASFVVRPLLRDSFLSSYHSSPMGGGDKGERLLFFDYGGVLLSRERFDIYLKQTLSAISGRRPDESIMSFLARLASDPKNIIVIITGLTRLKLGDVFDSNVHNSFENVTLACSNGLVYSLGKNLMSSAATGAAGTSGGADVTLPATNEGRQWLALLDSSSASIDWDAIAAIAVPIITKFTFRTNGTCQTPRYPGIGWSFFGADPDWGGKQAAQLTVELEAALANHDVKITSLIPGSIEVVPRTLSKANITKQLLNQVLALRAGKLPRFISIMGSDEQDAGLFEAVRDMIASVSPSAALSESKIWLITVGNVGRKEKHDGSGNKDKYHQSQFPHAAWYVNEVSDVQSLLQSMVGGVGTEVL